MASAEVTERMRSECDIREWQTTRQCTYNVTMRPVRATIVAVKVKVNCPLVQALRLCTGRTAYRESRGIALLFLDHRTRRGERSLSRPGRSLPPEKAR